MSEININSNNRSDIEISENNFIDVELDNGEIENIETEIREPDCIEIEINGLMSSNSFIGLEDTPMYYIDGKFFKVEGNKLVYTDIDWADITGDIKGNPGLEDQIKEIASQYSKEFIIESVDTAVQKHNLDEKSHPFLIDMILNNYASINKKVDEGLGLVNTRIDNLELTTNQNADNINVLLDEQADINQALNNIEYDVVKNASDIANLTPRVTNNENKIVELNEKIKDIAGADLTELNNKVNKNSGDITNLTQKVDNNYHELSLNTQNNFDILNNKIADNSIKINTNTQDIVDIKLKATTDYTELKNKINSNSTKIDTNTKDIYQNTLTINENTLAIADNSKLINSTIENLKSYSKTSAFASVAFSGEYTDLLNTPDIPSIDGLASTNYVNEYVNNAISGVVGLKFIVVDKLPEVGKNGYIYLVPDSKSTQDVYTEYIWLEDQQRFEQFGLSEVNLENYYTKDIVDAFLDTKVDKVAGKSLVSDTEINRLKNVKNYDDTEIKNSLDSKQDILIAGENIDITQNVISSVDTKYTAGEGINISKDNVISNTQTSAEWGKISGDINTQVDLVNKLDSKQNTLTEANAGNGISIENGVITNTKTETSWGEIKGDINSQLDLKKEFDNKQDINSLSINGVVLNNNKTLNELGIQPKGDYVTQDELPKDITTQGNIFNGSNQLVQLLNDGTLPRLDASNLYNVYGEKGDKGDKGDTSTIEIGSVVKGDIASVKNVGTKTDAIFDFVLPKGDTGRTATVKVGKVNKGDIASVKNVGTSNDAIFDFVLPKGDTGRTATVKVGKVEKGTTAKVTNVGTNNDAIFDFVLPKGDQGIQGIQGPQGKGANNGTQLTNQNLDTYKTEPLCGYYYAGGGNTVKPKPSGVDAFGLWVLRTAVGFYQQELHTANTNTNKVYIRTWNSSAWTPWVEKGVKGDTGARGPQGEQGPRGEKGETGDGYSDAYHMYMTGNVTNDERGYKQLVDMKHSTFDKSKFKVFGTPTITDGVVIGGTTQNNVWVDTSKYNMNNKSFSIKCSCEYHSDDTSEQMIWQDNWRLLNDITSGRNLSFRVPTMNNDADAVSINLENLGFKNNSVIYIVSELNRITKEVSLSVSDDNIHWHTSKRVITKELDETYLINYIRFGGFSNTVYFKYPIDLKQFSISVDGKEVFSGNKTGIDIIKKDNFTKIGNPVIAPDGISSNLDINNFFKVPYINLNNHKELAIEGTFKLSEQDIAHNRACIVGNVGYNDGHKYLPMLTFDLGRAYILYNNGTVDWTRSLSQNKLKANTQYSFVYKITPAKTELFINGKLDVQADTPSCEAFKNNTIGNLSICSSSNLNPFRLYGSIDLNTFKVYVDGNLVYQPMLRIPYTDSKTGSKIVDAIYRDRVKDVFEQTGKALYYTLDETNKNITLPAGEIYGLIGEGGSGGTGNPDNLTITINKDDALQAEGVLERNKKSAKFDWVGTLKEYETQKIATTHPSWICYITDDTSSGSSVYTKDEVNNLIANRADKDLGNITELGKEKIRQYSNGANKDLSNLTDAGKKAIKDNSGIGHMVGEFTAFLVTEEFTPEGYLLCDGGEYTEGLFPDLWKSYLHPTTIGDKQVTILDTCSYEEFANMVSEQGACPKFAVDNVRKTFKVPFIPNGYYVKQGNGTVNKAGLPNITGGFTCTALNPNSDTSAYGAFKGTSKKGVSPTGGGGSGSIDELDASLSNPIYGRTTDTVETNAIGVQWFVYVANAQIGQSTIDWNKFTTIIEGKASINLDNLTPEAQSKLGVSIKTAYVNGTSGYNIYSNGYCEQWGYIGQMSTTVKLLKKYRDTSYSVFTGNEYPATSDYRYDNGVMKQNKKVDSFELYSYYTPTINFSTNWRTYGYLPEGEY